MHMLLKKLITEFIGTFFLVITIGLVVTNPNIGALAPIAIGLMLTVMVYAGGPISGGHYNPAVSTAVLIRGKIAPIEFIFYVIAQLFAAFIASQVFCFLAGDRVVQALQPDYGKVFVAELLFTFALAYVVLSVATSPKAEGNSYFGLAIGGTVLTGAYSVGNISGAIFNPAVLLGVSLMQLLELQSIWVYVIAIFTGAILASFTFIFLNRGDL